MEIKNNWKIHFIIGFVIIAMEIFYDYVTGGSRRFLENFTLAGLAYKVSFYLSFFSVYFINIKIICPRVFSKKPMPIFILSQLSLFFIFAGIRYFLEEIVIYNISGYHNYSEYSRRFWYYIFDNSYFSLKLVLFSLSIYLFFKFLDSQKQIHQLEQEQLKAEMGALKMQLEPHFLFNTLNVFYTELVDKQPETAKGILKLSELLRHLTYEAKKDEVLLSSEIKFIEDYIFFYRKRFEENLYVNIKITGVVDQQMIPSLILIHFIENMFKHGIVNSKTHPASINITISSNELELETSNKVSTAENYSTEGIGKENLQKRLDIIYQNNYIFTSGLHDDVYKTYLKIALK